MIGKLFCAGLVAATLSGAACGYSKETVSLYRDHVGMRVPNQQRLLALSTDEAVQRLDFKPLAGKKVVVEMTGVFPHSRNEIIDYIQGQVEGKIARDGGVVISAGQLVVAAVDAQTFAAGSGSAAPAQQPPAGTISLTPGDADYRVVVGVSWAGVDTHDRKSIDTALLGKQLGLVGGGLLFGALGSSSGDASTGAGIAGLGALAMIGGVVWYLLDTPTLHTYRLLGRVRLSVNALPVVPGGTAFQVVGEGQTELLVDPSASEGYILQ